MVLKNEDINLLIKMENLIGINEKKIFGKNKNKIIKIKTSEKSYDVTYNDFLDYMNLIERIYENKKKLSDKSNKYNKANKEYHRIINGLYEARKDNNQERIERWTKKLEEYKKEKNNERRIK